MFEYEVFCCCIFSVHVNLSGSLSKNNYNCVKLYDCTVFKGTSLQRLLQHAIYNRPVIGLKLI